MNASIEQNDLSKYWQIMKVNSHVLSNYIQKSWIFITGYRETSNQKRVT